MQASLYQRRAEPQMFMLQELEQKVPMILFGRILLAVAYD
jgi:hypothetical protein